MAFARRSIGMALPLSLLASCSYGRAFEYGYGYDLTHFDVMVGIRVTDTRQSLADGVEVELAYGHHRRQEGPILRADSVPGPVCVYIDNNYSEDDHEEDPLDYRLFRSFWHYVSEVPSEVYWTDAYAFDDDFFHGKSFMHTETLRIDPSLFVTEKREDSNTETITIIVTMLWQSVEDGTWAAGFPGDMSFGYMVEDGEVRFVP